MCSFRLYGSLAEMSQDRSGSTHFKGSSHPCPADTIVLCPERPAQAFNIAKEENIDIFILKNELMSLAISLEQLLNENK